MRLCTSPRIDPAISRVSSVVSPPVRLSQILFTLICRVVAVMQADVCRDWILSSFMLLGFLLVAVG